jgi:glucosyl-3-phosphoglycerate synthase
MSAAGAERSAQLRTFHHSRFPAEAIAARRERSVTVCLPARECAGTIGGIVERLARLRAVGVLDEIVVVDAASADGTAAIAAAAGARVLQEAELLPAAGPVLGKGDAMWRGLSAIDSDIVCFLDADSEGFAEHFALGLLGPLVCEPEVAFVKGFYRRPLTLGGVTLPDAGGRVNHLLARPALAVFYPELAGVRQPLAGEVAAPRELLERLPFATGYGVEIAMLIDVSELAGTGSIVQVDLDEHRNRSKSIAELTPMAETVLATLAARLARAGRLTSPAGTPAAAPPERPPLARAGAA